MEDNIISTGSPIQHELDVLNEHIRKVKAEVGKLVVGQEKTVDLILAGIFIGGHILLEGVPGIAKTLTAKLVAKTLSVDFRGFSLHRI